VKDFVGDACKTLASRVRGAVSSITFEDFHHHSALKIREAVFGKTRDSVLREELVFPANNLVITSVDIKDQEITDASTRAFLQKSINLAIEISSQSQEANSRHQALRLDQENKGHLDRQKLEDLARAEEANIKLIKLKAESEGVSMRGESIAAAKARAEADRIKGETEVK